MKNLRLLLILAVCLLAAGSLAAQTYRGGIAGTVTDASGAEGYYVATELPIGNYSVTVEVQGFQTAVATGIRVEVAGERRVDITLQPGAMTQRTEVVAEVTLVETTSNVLGGTLERRQVEELP